MAELKIKADSGGGTVSLKGPSTTTSNAAVQLTLPVDDGTASQYLQTNGSGVLSWATVSSTPEGTAIKSTGETGTTKFLRIDGDNTCSWQVPPASSGPLFRAQILAVTNQGLAGDTQATVQFTEELHDTDSCYDTSTYKFTPNKAGYYQVNYHVGFSASNNATSAWVFLQKNDAAYSQISQSNDWCYHMDMTSSDIVYLNGSSDSIRLRAEHNSSGDTFTLFDGAPGCYFSAYWIRS